MLSLHQCLQVREKAKGHFPSAVPACPVLVSSLSLGPTFQEALATFFLISWTTGDFSYCLGCSFSCRDRCSDQKQLGEERVYFRLQPQL